MSRKFCALNLLTIFGIFIWTTTWLTIGYGMLLKNPNEPHVMYYTIGCMIIGIFPILTWLLSMIKSTSRQNYTSRHAK